ncbi:MAG: AmmeMemoRadiSam system protein B [Theionarchaea archaeon]|nr:AmmeMemoRadiSam system protein B [Theionarchaea archaeon]MBU7039118.1 AmmeMemoRadiSam system protein B [Theionarchaea archaeon]
MKSPTRRHWGAILLITLLIGVYCGIRTFRSEESEVSEGPDDVQIVRLPAVAGQFYSSSQEELEQSIVMYLDQVPDLNMSSMRALVCPHAGYVYSGLTAAYCYGQLDDVYDTVILIGPSHYVRFQGASVPDYTHYKTPLGLVKVSDMVTDMKKNGFITVPDVDVKEHCLEVQLPFLQTVLSDFEIVPIVIGDIDPRELASALSPYIDDRTLVVASSDLSHYHPYEEARELDEACTMAVPALDFDRMSRCEACGTKAMETVMYLAQQNGWQGSLLDYRTSGDTAGGKEQVVGYMGIAFCGALSIDNQSMLNEQEQRFLLQLARQTLEQYLSEGTFPDVDESDISQQLKENGACFVTLNKKGMLRGCIGTFTWGTPLYRAVMKNSVNAALRDPRFMPLTYDELGEVSVEISVLTTPHRIWYKDNEDLCEKIREKGVIVTWGRQKATYLPQVWEQLPDPEEFLSQLCVKAGLSADYWKQGRLMVQVYTAQVFHEE